MIFHPAPRHGDRLGCRHAGAGAQARCARPRPEAWSAFATCAASPLGRFALFGWSWALSYHLLNGLRHLAQDGGWGYDIPRFVASSWTSVVGSLVLTAAIWACVLMRGGAA